MIVLHGGPGLTHDYLLPEWTDLALDHRVVLYDQRACGAGRAGGVVGAPRLIADLDRLIAHVSPERPVVLAGSSWGSMLAAYYALDHPERVAALVLSGFAARWVESSPLAGTTLPRIGLRSVPQDADSLGVERALAYMEMVSRRMSRLRPARRDYASTPDQLEARRLVAEELAVRFVEDCPEAATAIRESLRPLRSLGALRTLGFPTLLFADDLMDRSFDEAIDAPTVLEGTAIRVVAGGGHDPWYTRTDLFFRCVRDFLRDLPGDAAPRF